MSTGTAETRAKARRVNRRRGRPSKLTRAVLEDIAASIVGCMTHRIAATRAGVSVASFYLWRSRGEEAALALEETGELPESEALYLEFYDALQEADIEAEANILAKIVGAGLDDPKQWRALAWIAERRWPERYRPTRQNMITGPDGKGVGAVVLDVSGLDRRALEALAAGEPPSVESEPGA